MTAAASLWVKLGLSDSEFIKGLKKAENDLKRFGDRLGNLGSRLTVGISLPLALASGACIKLGMDAVESENLFTVSMGKMSNAARTWSQDLRKNLGLNEYELRRNVGLYQTMSTAMGLTENSAFNLSKGVTELGYDMASFFNVSNAQALSDLRAIWTGEVEPVKKYGIVLLETNIKQWALNNGLIRQGQEMTAAQKVVARYNLVLEQTKNAQGDLARTLDSPANKLRILQEQLKMAATEMGIALMPAVTGLMKALTPLVQKIAQLAQWFANLPTPIQNTIGVLLGVSIAIGPVLLGIGKMFSGWSALIGVLRMFPTGLLTVGFAKLKDGLFGIGYLLPSIFKGGAEAKTALSLLAGSFGPFLVGGVIIVGLTAIVGLFMEISKQAKITAMDMKNATSVAEIQQSIQLNQQKLSEVQKMQSGDKKILAKGESYYAKDYAGTQSYIRAQNRQEQLRLDALKYGTQIQAGQERLKQLNSQTNVSVPSFNAADFMANLKTEMPNIIADQTEKAILAPLKESVAKVGGVLGDTVKISLGGIKKEAEAAQPKITEFGDYLNQTSAIFGDMQGPLKSFAETVVGVINSLKSIQSNATALTPGGFAANSAGPLGAVGGILSAIGGITGILGAFQSIVGLFSGSEAAAEKQQKAAEKWLSFLDKASVSEMFGAQTGLENKLVKLQKEAKELQRKADLSGSLGAPFLLKLKSVKAEIEKIKKQLGDDLPQAIASSLGISVDNLANSLEGAFSAVSADELLTKFDQSFNGIIRNAMIKNFISEQALGPLSDAMMAAFDPLSEGGNSVTAGELANLKAMWATIGEEGKGFFGILDQLGLNMEGLSKETDNVSASMRNVPTGFKYALNAFSMANTSIPSYALGTTTSNLTSPGTTAATGSSTGEIHIHLEGAQIYGVDDFNRMVQTSVNMATGRTMAAQGV